MKAAKCIACGMDKLDRNTVGLNNKLLGNDVVNFYCMDCLADYLSVTKEELQEKIKEFKEQGCKQFE